MKSDMNYEVVLIDATESPIERPKKTKILICTDFSNCKKHDFGLLKESKILINPKVKVITDTGYQGIQKIHNNSELPKKKSKKNPLTKNDKKNNLRLARERVVNENVIGMLKRFKIIADKYRNKRKRFGLRFNLISAIYTFDLP
ncbi:IS5 family transposase ISOt6 [Orientia tsutsugamushi]|nr:transposase DDE domain protein [Orientia tsutsugamushi str. TA763]KJV75821.1 transposase DDE domain protein [Orientia tsutsugamushi str. TA763]SPP24163.1 IS5 family transposase ISOt6 [Orientia tsutsugamushi]